MDKGRIMDNIQNSNARFIDKYGDTNKTSVKTSNPPGNFICIFIFYRRQKLIFTRMESTRRKTSKNKKGAIEI